MSKSEWDNTLDLWSDFLQSMALLFGPVAAMPYSTLFILLVSISLVLLSIGATRKLTDVEKLKTNMQEIKAWREKVSLARKTMDPYLLQEVMDNQGRILRLNSGVMGARMKPMCLLYVPLIIIFLVLQLVYQTSPVAILPFNIQIIFPFFEGLFGVNVPGSGFGLYMWVWYFMSSLGLGTLIRKFFGLDLT